jgi:ATP-binding protein involved in chromosome partitioning
VTTPQKAATQIARKGGIMLDKVNVPLLGVIENMSYLEVPGSSERIYLYGQGGGAQTALDLGTELLGQIPQDTAICQGGDTGKPVVVAQPDGTAAGHFRAVAEKILKRLRASGV